MIYVVGDSSDENNFSHKLLLTNTQVSKLRKAFSNGSLANIKLSKIHLSKMIQSGEFKSIWRNFVISEFSIKRIKKYGC